MREPAPQDLRRPPPLAQVQVLDGQQAPSGAAQRRQQKIFRVTGVDRVLPLYASVDSATASLDTREDVVDATIVRCLLVPARLTLLGEHCARRQPSST